MRKAVVIVLTALLMAAAFFLPAELSAWNDQQLLDEPHITQEDEREGFAESVQLTVAEKLLLLQSGTLNSMVLGDLVIQGGMSASVFVNRAETANEISLYVEEEFPGDEATLAMETDAEQEKTRQKWFKRLSAVRSEVRTLQAMGAMPQLWDADSELEFHGYGETLYVDSTTRMSFQAYRMRLDGAPFSLDVLVDAQSQRILAFNLDWYSGTPLNWGFRGAASFGTAWRDYWGLDSVNDSWYSDYVKSILENTDAMLHSNGEYNANGQIIFSYGGQSLQIPVANWAFYDRNRSLWWNYL